MTPSLSLQCSRCEKRKCAFAPSPPSSPPPPPPPHKTPPLPPFRWGKLQIITIFCVCVPPLEKAPHVGERKLRCNRSGNPAAKAIPMGAKKVFPVLIPTPPPPPWPLSRT